MIQFIFYDRFANEYTTERDAIAPPERYIVVWRGVSDIFTETYKDNNLKRFCSISYTKEERENGFAEPKRRFYLEEYNMTHSRLIDWTIPADMFDEIIKEDNLTPFSGVDDYKQRTGKNET